MYDDSKEEKEEIDVKTMDKTPANPQRFPPITVKAADVLDFPCDVLVLKYAQAFYGVDDAVSSALARFHPKAAMEPSPGECSFLPTLGAIAAKNVLFVGVVDLRRFEYGQIRKFGYHAMRYLAKHLPDAASVAMTTHGNSYGLDERESFLAQLAGIGDAVADELYPSGIESLTIVERDEGRARRLDALFQGVIRIWGSREDAGADSGRPSGITAGQNSATKPHVFVAMPFSEGEMEDVFAFGIQGPVNKAGYLCERVDMSVFTGDIMERVHERIETAQLVIADLTGANPNVYLEVGLAWGRGKSTLLLIKDGSDLKFDVRGHRSIRYKNITDLSQKLSADLAVLLSGAVP